MTVEYYTIPTDAGVNWVSHCIVVLKYLNLMINHGIGIKMFLGIILSEDDPSTYDNKHISYVFLYRYVIYFPISIKIDWLNFSESIALFKLL